MFRFCSQDFVHQLAQIGLDDLELAHTDWNSLGKLIQHNRILARVLTLPANRCANRAQCVPVRRRRRCCVVQRVGGLDRGSRVTCGKSGRQDRELIEKNPGAGVNACIGSLAPAATALCRQCESFGSHDRTPVPVRSTSAALVGIEKSAV